MKSLMNKFKSLDYEQLVSVNGGYGSRSSSSSGGGYSSSSASGISYVSSSYSQTLSTSLAGYDALTSGLDAECYVRARANAGSTASSGSSSGSTGGIEAASELIGGGNLWNQTDFSARYGTTFGNNACAATSLLNEVSETYTAVTGKQMTATQAVAAMDAAINDGYIGSGDAYVNSWASAATSMMQAAGVNGRFDYTSNLSSATNVVYCRQSADGSKTHFVSTIGKRLDFCYDPYSGQVCYKNDLYANYGTVSARGLYFSKNR